jgi:putative tricarboxylic transport membrane protein
MTAHRISSLCLTTVGLLAGLMMVPLRLWEYGAPGAGLFPFVAGLMLFFTGLGSALQDRAEEIDEEPADRGRLLRYSVAIAGFLIAIPVAGLLAATFSFVAGVLHWIEGKTLLGASVAGAGLAFLSWLLFDLLLGVPLPTGLLGIG